MSETYQPRQKIVSKAPLLSDILTIANPKEYPAKPRVEPKPHHIELMSRGLAEPPRNAVLEVMRISQAEVEELASWAEGKFLERWPAVTEQMILHYARMAASSNNYAAYRTLQSWGVVQLIKHPFDPKPIAELMFLVTKRPVHDELMALVRTCMNWARAMGAAEFRVSEYTDFDLAPILKKMGIDSVMTSSFVRL